MEGTISHVEFKDQCNNLLDVSKLLNDGWQKKVLNGESVEYIVKKITRATEIVDLGKTRDDEMQFEDENGLSESYDACEKITSSKDENVIFFEYQVMYSESFNIPVLYFFASTPNGRNLSLEDVWKQVPAQYHNALDERWSFITQTEHPLLGCPVFFIHPCHTAKMMLNLTQLENKQNIPGKRKRYLLTWLSAVGPIVGLNISMEYFK